MYGINKCKKLLHNYYTTEVQKVSQGHTFIILFEMKRN